MSETTALTTQPDTTKLRINVRKALAGLYALQGEGSQYACLKKAGFAHGTARRPEANGLSAERCIEEAAKFEPLASPAKLLEAARGRMAQSLALIDPSKTALRDVTRAFEAVEKLHGGHQISTVNTALGLADRLAELVSILVVARERGLPVPAIPATFEAEIVATAPQLSSESSADLQK